MPDTTKSSSGEPQTNAGERAQAARIAVSEVASETANMGLFIGLLLSSAVLLIVREAELAAFPIPNGLLTGIMLCALVVGSAMDTSIVPDS